MLGVWIIENDPKRTLGQNRNRNCSCQGLESEHIKIERVANVTYEYYCRCRNSTDSALFTS
jgi:hypothetical protein